MELQQLRYFISAAKHLNFTKAASECNVVQTNISHQIAALEEELGVCLLERSRRSMSLTAAGEFFLEEARQIVSKVEKAKDMTRVFEDMQKRRISIGYYGLGPGPIFSRILKEYKNRYSVNFKLINSSSSHEGLLERLRREELDFVFLARSNFSNLEWVNYRILYYDTPVLAVSSESPLAGRKSIHVKELAKISEPILYYQATNDADLLHFNYRLFTRTFHLNMNRVQFNNNMLEIFLFVESGLSTALMLKSTLNYANRNQNITLINIDGVNQAPISLAWNKHNSPPFLNSFIEVIAEQVKIAGL